MSNKIKTEIESFIARILPASKKQLDFIRKNDWRDAKTIKQRADKYNLQRVLNAKAVDNMSKLYRMAEKNEDLANKKVKNALKLLRSYYTIMDERYITYSEDISWMEHDPEGKAETENAKAVKVQEEEVKLRSSLLEDINKAEHMLRDINDGNEDTSVSINLHGGTPIPFMMEKAAKKKWPEIILLEKELQKELDDEE